ncbi:hypothetical protein G9A89_004426 [Geosiphon pyriformis]|nr:hypothetical protein G9A89_004426 [Geosiphon pyriformis]
MENKEIKRTTRPESHDCNVCFYCQDEIRMICSNWVNRCRACQFIFFEKLYKNFSSGNKEVDEIIRNPIYIPPNKNNDYYARLKYYEWIPWERLSNINQIARGGFSIIYKATLIDGLIDVRSIKHNGEMDYKREGTVEVVIKIMSTNSEEVFKELNIERAIFINCDKKDNYYISNIIGITQNAETLEYGIVMPFAKLGDMRKYLSTNFHSMSWDDKLLIAGDIAEGLKQIHSFGMVHRDLHSGNILKFSNERINIGDLGLCQPVKNEATTTTEEKYIYGVIPYIPPEVLRGEKFTKAGDIYSYGMLLLELVTGKPPFYDRSHDHLLIIDILNGIRPEITFPLIPPRIAEIIITCWDVNPENRPTAREVWSKLLTLLGMYERFRDKNSTDEELGPQFLESDKYVKEMAESDDSTTTNQSTTTMTTTTTRIHPGAVYTSRVLTLQMIDFSKEFVFLPKDDS